jgi:hypothetical protein
LSSITGAELSNWAQIIGIPLALIAVFFAWNQVRQGAQLARGQFLLSIDDALARYEDLRSKINTKDWSPIAESVRKSNDLRRYLTVFERIGFLVERGSLDFDTVHRNYGHLLIRLLKKKGIDKVIQGDPALDAHPGRWNGLLLLWNRLCQDHPDLPRPPEVGDEGARKTARRELKEARASLYAPGR